MNQPLRTRSLAVPRGGNAPGEIVDLRFAGSALGRDGMPMSQALRAPVLAALLQLTPVEPGSGLRVLELDTDWQCGASAVEVGGPVWWLGGVVEPGTGRPGAESAQGHS